MRPEAAFRTVAHNLRWSIQLRLTACRVQTGATLAFSANSAVLPSGSVLISQWITGVYCGGYLLVRRAASAAVTAPRRHITTPAICTEFQSTAASTNGPILNARRRKPGDPGGGMASLNRPMDHLTTIALRPEDLDFLFLQVSEPGLNTRNVDGFDNNLSPGRAYWGTAEQPFLRLTPPQYEPRTETQTSPNAVRATSADGATPLPNPRTGQQPDRPAGTRRGREHDRRAESVWHQPVPDVLRTVLRPRPRFLPSAAAAATWSRSRTWTSSSRRPSSASTRSAPPRASPRPARPDRQPPRAARERPAALRLPHRQPGRPLRCAG